MFWWLAIQTHAYGVGSLTNLSQPDLGTGWGTLFAVTNKRMNSHWTQWWTALDHLYFFFLKWVVVVFGVNKWFHTCYITFNYLWNNCNYCMDVHITFSEIITWIMKGLSNCGLDSAEHQLFPKASWVHPSFDHVIVYFVITQNPERVGGQSALPLYILTE